MELVKTLKYSHIKVTYSQSSLYSYCSLSYEITLYHYCKLRVLLRNSFYQVRQDDVKVRDKDFGFHSAKRENREQDYTYANPIPPDMRAVPLEDLNPVAIDWKMLTSIRPKSKLEEEMFSRSVYCKMYHKNCSKNIKGSCGGSGYMFEDQKSSMVPSRHKRFFCSPKVSQIIVGAAHPPSCSMGTRDSFCRGKEPGVRS